MFYVSDILGAQQPYTAEIYQAQREERLERLAALRAEEDFLESYDPDLKSSVKSDKSALGGQSSSFPQTSSQSGAAHVAVGLAGASMLKRDEKAASQESSSSDSPKDQKKLKQQSDFPKQIKQVSPSSVVQKKEPDSDKHSFPNLSTSTNPYYHLDQPNQQREPAVQAAQIMSKNVVTLAHDDTIATAFKLFRTRRFRHVPVTSAEGKLIGILSDRDFLGFSAKSTLEQKTHLSTSSQPVREVMATNVLSARPETEIRFIANIMFKERIGAMPIVNENAELVGILTRSDILRIIVNKAPLELWV